MTDHPTLSLRDAARILREAESVLILIHRKPDGDAAGSGFALAQILRRMGKTARVVCGEPVPERLRFLMRDQEDCTYTEGMEDSFALLCAVDTASPSQLGSLAHLIPKISLSLDHHGANTPFSPHFTKPDASAAGEVLFDLYRMLTEGGQLAEDADICRLLYSAIVSDTGGFQHSNTTPNTHLCAAALMEKINAARDGGDDTAMLCHRLLGCRTQSELRAQRAGMDALRLAFGGRLGAVVCPQEMLREHGLTNEDIGNIVDLPRSVAGVLIALSLKQDADDPTSWHVSSRASFEGDVSAVCAQFGGGGHTRAAGCTVTASDGDEAFAIVCRAFGAILPPQPQEV